MPKQLEDEFCAAFERAIDAGESSDELLMSVRALVRELKAEGRPPENVLVTIKDLCGLTHDANAADTDSTPSFSESKRISDLVVSTVIDEYYNGTTTTGSEATRSETSGTGATGSGTTGHRPWQGYAMETGDELR
jgi:hypothetical protein